MVASQSSNSRSMSATRKFMLRNGSVSSKMIWYNVFGVDEFVAREDGYLRVIPGTLIVVRMSG